MTNYHSKEYMEENGIVKMRSKLLNETFYLNTKTGIIDFVDDNEKYLTHYRPAEWKALKNLADENILEVHRIKKLFTNRASEREAYIKEVRSKGVSHQGIYYDYEEPNNTRRENKYAGTKTLDSTFVFGSAEEDVEKTVRNKQKSVFGLHS